MSRMPRILFVEDDQELAQAYTTRLAAEGFEVKHCANGEEALTMAINYQPDLILLDVMMPKISGLDVLDILRNTPETKGVKIVVLSALGQPEDIQKAKDRGADDYLVKSQTVITAVIDRLRFHLGLNRGQQPFDT